MYNYQQLLQEKDRECNIQKKIIQNQEKQITTLQELNSELKNQLADWKNTYADLLVSYDEVVDLCRQQQQLLDSILEESDT